MFALRVFAAVFNPAHVWVCVVTILLASYQEVHLLVEGHIHCRSPLSKPVLVQGCSLIRVRWNMPGRAGVGLGQGRG